MKQTDKTRMRLNTHPMAIQRHRISLALFGLCAMVQAGGAEPKLRTRIGASPTPPSKADFSADSLIASGGRGGRLYPAGTNFTEQANREMGEAMEIWNSRRWREGNAMFNRIYQQTPDSPWAAEAELHVAAFDRLNGYFEDSEERFLAVLAKHGDESDGIKQRVLLHLPQLYWETGRPRAALACLNLMTETEMDWPRRQFYENWMRIFGNAIQQEEHDRKCGPLAAALALEAISRSKPDQPLINMTLDKLSAKYPWAGVESKHPDGYSLAEVAALCGGKPRQMDFATLRRAARPGCPIVAYLEPPPESKLFDRMKRERPSGYRQSSGHFVVVESVTDRLVTILDPRFGRIRQEVNRFTFTWKGKALVLPGQDMNLGQALADEAASAARGGCCGSPTPSDSLDVLDETIINGKDQPKVCTNTKGAGGGAPSYRFGLPNANLNVSDIPMWMPSARGPDLAIQLDHNRVDSRNGAEYTNVNYYCFGNKWSFNYASIYREALSENVTVFLPGGRHEAYYKTNNAYIAKSLRNKNRLEIVGSEAKLTVDLDDSAYYFSTNTEWLLRMEDRHGNSATCQHDTVTGWLTNVVDSAGRSLAFKYSDQGCVTNITDNLGRNSAFAYSNGNLVSMTDMGGYEAKLKYDTNNWITSVVYPQGLTNTFNYANGSKLNSPYDDFQYEGYPAFRIRAVNSLNYTNEYFYHAFEATGPISVRDPGGNAWMYAHDAAEPYSFITSDAVNMRDDESWGYTLYGHQWVRRVYEANGVNLAEVHYATAPFETINGDDYTTLGISRYFTYDTNDWLIGERWTTNGVTCAVWSNQYDAVGNLLERVDPLGNSDSFTYNDRRDLIAATNALGCVVRIGYNPDGTVAAVTNARGYVTRWQYDAHGFNTNIVFPDNTANAMTYDAVGRRLTFKDAAGDQADFAYDNLDRLTNIAFSSDSTRLTYACSFTGATNITDRLGRCTVIGRDVLGRATSMTDARGDTVGMAYDAMNNVTRIDMGMGTHTNSLKFEYSSTNGYTRLARTVSAMGRTNSNAYTFRGWLASQTDPMGNVTTFAHDALGRAVAIAHNGETNVTTSYDILDRVTAMDDQWSANSFAYDVVGQTTSRTATISVPGFSGVCYRVEYAYDPVGNLTNRVLTGLAGFNDQIAETRAYDSMNRLTLVSNSFAWAAYGCDSAGRLAAKTYGNGDVTTYGYGPESRLVSLTTSNAGVDVQGWNYQYNAMGMITNMTDGETQLAYEYDAADRLVTETRDATNVCRWTYDPMGNRLTASNATGILWYSYDDDNALTHISASTTDWIRVTGSVDPGPRSNKWYNSWASLAGRTRHVSPTDGTFQFESVPLTAGTNTLTVTVQDVSGNTCTQNVTFTKGSVSGTMPTYDENGNLTGMVQGSMTNSYEYDAANRLVKATSNGVTVLECWYDGGGRRIAKREVAGGVTNAFQYVYDGMTIMAVLNEQGQLLEYYTRGLGVGGDVGTVVAATHTTDSWTNGTFYMHNDHRGDVRTVRAGTNTAATYDYTAFGEVRNSTGNYHSRFLFSSKECDPSTGFYNFGLRHLSPNFGRFVTPDPLGLAGGLNPCAFARNNPVNNIDPFGLYVWQTQYWADLSVNGNWAQRGASWILGPLSGLMPSAVGYSGGGSAGAGLVGSVGGANMRFTGAGDECSGSRHGVYTTVGHGIGTPQAGVSAGATIGWYTEGISTPESFSGPFTEDNITVGPLSGTGWLGGGWLGITFGGSAGWPSIGSLSRQTVDYQLQNK